MEQNLNDKPLSNMQIARYIESLRKEMNFDDEVYGLVKSDLDSINAMAEAYCSLSPTMAVPASSWSMR